MNHLSNKENRVRPEYFIDKDDINYSLYKRQINLLNETSLNLDNCIPINSGIKRRKINEEANDEDEKVGEFDLGEALRLVDLELDKEKI